MKNLASTLVFIFITTLFISAQSKYEAGMQKAFGLWQEGKSMEAIALFERIGQAEKDNWIPLYHAANILISGSFEIQDVNQRNETLEKAKGIIAEAHQRSKNNSEILTLEGLLYTGYVAMDPENYGMTMSPKIMELHSKAVAINPENPRALANQIQFEMGAARFFGEDLQPFCDRMNEIIPKFENQSSEVPFAPTHGIETAQYVINSCK